MDFKKSTDDLFAKVSHNDFAKALGVSVASVRQARLPEGAAAHRNPPADWQSVAIKLAEKKAEHFRRLAARLGASPAGDS